MIKNLTKNIIISDNAEHCRSIFSKARGLMFALKPKILIFYFDQEQLNPLHMFFVFFSIDVLFLDSKKQVVEIKENFRPFAFYNPKNKSKYIIEFPNQSIKNISIGDILKF